VSRDPNARLVYATGGLPAAEKESAAELKAGAKSGVRLRLERRASNRLVTVVSGLPGDAQQLAALAKALKSACGTGGTLKDGALELQGDQREKVEAALHARGIRSKRAGG
jgi:translation initiation factor 1